MPPLQQGIDYGHATAKKTGYRRTVPLPQKDNKNCYYQHYNLHLYKMIDRLNSYKTVHKTRWISNFALSKP